MNDKVITVIVDSAKSSVDDLQKQIQAVEGMLRGKSTVHPQLFGLQELLDQILGLYAPFPVSLQEIVISEYQSSHSISTYQ